MTLFYALDCLYFKKDTKDTSFLKPCASGTSGHDSLKY